MVFKKSWQLGRGQIKIEWRKKANAMGRFGGGWNWKLGISWAPSTTIIDLFVLSIRFNRLPLCEYCDRPVTSSKYDCLGEKDYAHYHPEPCYMEALMELQLATLEDYLQFRSEYKHADYRAAIAALKGHDK